MVRDEPKIAAVHLIDRRVNGVAEASCTRRDL
jgi:hypothetical protein